MQNEKVIKLAEVIADMINETKESAKEQLIEVAKAEYIHPSFEPKLHNKIMYRFNQKNARYYFTNNVLAESTTALGKSYSANDYITFYPSVTTVIDAERPTDYSLRKLIGDMGLDGFYKFMKERAHYGTLMHTFITEYIMSSNEAINRHFDFRSLASKIEAYANKHKMDVKDALRWEYDIKKDLLALISFLKRHKVQPLAVELVGHYKDPTSEKRFAGAIDLICEMEIEEKGFFGEVYKSGEKKDQPKESKIMKKVIAIVDFKSGKNGFYESHIIQLHMYKMIVEQNFGITIDKVFNVSPKDWRSEPDFHIKDQTDEISQHKIPFLLGSYFVDYEDPKNITFIDGIVNGSDDFSSVYHSVPAADYVFNELNKSA